MIDERIGDFEQTVVLHREKKRGEPAPDALRARRSWIFAEIRQGKCGSKFELRGKGNYEALAK
jgi:hypothetical protein